MKRSIFDVEYADAPDEVRVYRTRVVMADQVYAETHGPKFGVLDPTKQSRLLGSVWLFLSSRREGHIAADVEFDEFLTKCLDNAKVEEEDVPPTWGPSAGPSPSPVPSPASPGESG